MSKILFALFALALPCAAQTIDINQPNTDGCMSGTWQDDLAQSFTAVSNNCSGAGFLMYSGFGGTDDIEIKLYDDLPNRGGNILASGNVLGNPGLYADVFWDPVSVTPGQVYYLVIGANFGSMCLAGDTTNPYLGGICYANSPYFPWPNFDYTFRTWTQDRPILNNSGSCPQVSLDVTFGTPFGQVAFLTSNAYGFFSIPGGLCAGTTLQLANPVLRNIQTCDNLGNLQVLVTVPAGACGQMLVEVVDLTSCKPSNIIAL